MIGFLFKYWGEVVLCIIAALIFFSGWHLRGLQDVEKEQNAIITQAKNASDISVNYEESLAMINELSEKLDTKVTYENTYNCLIPADGLQLLSKAIR